MTEPQGHDETQTERVSGQPVDSKAELWRPGGTGETAEPERGRDEETVGEPGAGDESEAR